MPQITSLIYDPSPGVTPGDGSIIRTDQHDAILDLLNGISTENYNLVQKISKKTTTYAILLTDFAIICDATSAGFTVTLPDATSTGISRKMYAIKKSDSTANIVTVATTSSQTIDGVVGTTLTQQNEVIFLQSDGTNWQLLGRSLRSILPLANIFTADQTIREDDAAAQLFLEAYGTGNYGHYISKAARGTLASPTASLANDILESIEARGYGATGFSAAGIAQIRLLAGENLTDAHYGSYISFLTTKNTTTTLSEAMRINGDGTWMIWNPAFTFKYTITPAAITADRVLNIPLVTADDTIAVLGLAQTFTKGQTISPSSLPGLTLNAASGLAGSSTVFRGGLYNVAGTTTFTGGTAQTGDYTTNYFDIVTLANGTTSGTITNAATVKIIGAPAAGSNMTITNAYALWVAAGTTKLDGSISATGVLTSTGGITMSSANITLAGNKINTSNFFISDISNGDFFLGGHAVRVTGNGTNQASVLTLLPQGTSVRSSFQLNRVSDTTNWETLFIGSDLNGGNEFDIISYNNGTGTLRPINIWMKTTKLLSFDTSNSVSTWVTFSPQAQIYQSYDNGDMMVLYRPNSTVSGLNGIRFDANNASSADSVYAGIYNEIIANTAGAQTGQLDFFSVVAGTNSVKLKISTNIQALTAIVPQSDTGSSVTGIDASGGTQFTITSGSTATPFGNSNNFAGLFVIQDVTGGGVAFVATGNGNVTIIWQGASAFVQSSSPSATQTGIYLSSSILTLKNGFGVSHNYIVTAVPRIKTAN